MATLSTRIQLRTDTIDNWENPSSITLKYGEIAIAKKDDDIAEIRIGTGDGQWSDALQLGLNATQTTTISDLISTATDPLLASQDFADLSNAIGLSAASATNKVVTQDDIKDLAGAMHFRGAVTPTEGETDQQALARVITDPASGDFAIITTTSREFVYNGTEWIELGAEELYATKAQVSVDIATANGEANQYTDNAVAALSADRFALSADVTPANISSAIGLGNYAKTTALDSYVLTSRTVVGKALSGDVTASDISSAIGLSSYALSDDVNAEITNAMASAILSAVNASEGTASDLSNTITIYGTRAYAENIAQEKVDALSNSILVLACGDAFSNAN